LDVVKTAKSVMVYPRLMITSGLIPLESMSHSFDLPPNARVLITGAAGYVGQALVQALALCTPASWQWVLTDTQAAEGAISGAHMQWVVGDLSDPRVSETLFEQPVHAVVHLAGWMSGRTEQDVALGERINLHACLDLLARCRAQYRQGGPLVRWLMTSSIAVYGTPLPPRIDDSTPQRPTLSYGTHKRMLELMLDDMNRRGDLDGRAVRLSGVVLRPVLPNGALSGFNSDLIREPLLGREYVCPVSPDARLWLLSLPAALAHLTRLLGLDHATWSQVMGPAGTCALNAPAWPVTVHEVLEAMVPIDPQAPQRVQFAPQADIEAQFGAWPLDVSFALAEQLSLTDERQTFKHDLTAFLRQLALPFLSP
jgi:nucleoside-diphosphate-sugar epimerase